MRKMRLLAAAVLLTACGMVSAQFVSTPTPVSPNGTRAIADLPTSQHKRNVGGIDGAGLCVFTSFWHSCIWGDERAVFEFRDWMKRKPGGGYPEKFDAMLKQYCAEKGIPVPAYVQHTGGDDEFLRLALKTGRMPAVTYCGVDGKDSYGGEVVAHMVSLAHLDDKEAAIIDNNFPGRWLWMSAQDFLCRWRGVQPNGRPWYAGRTPIGGGWAIVLLSPPPAPYPAKPANENAAACICGDKCECAKGDCPAKCRVLYGQCANGKCQLPVILPQPTPPGVKPAPIGQPPSERHEWAQYDDGTWGWRFKKEPAAVPAVVETPKHPEFPRDGVDGSKLGDCCEYRFNGSKVTRAEAHQALLLDDSSKWNLAVVGDDKFRLRVAGDLAKLPGELRAKIHPQSYAPDSWQATQFKLPNGVTLRAPAVQRIGATLGSLAVVDYTGESLNTLLNDAIFPAPKPQPKPQPQPIDPKPVDPKPTPKQPDPVPQTGGNWVLALLSAVVVFFLLTRKA